ncbi:cation:proton antiporter [Brevundimonas variabilis]|uniref:CPA2 family monovalent cation:H+ antiporter-2 n=1 Tax=Brevundimonas variabilis TaxID=74312 RepID=A0A7W9CIW8_9CAUL|nr:cation:proton antiporter [Brevundimonas variabilis]MBB5746027.1 CPA2 family monovalent cation:H+ antiporter-2 [Brevundimonas variabilis]
MPHADSLILTLVAGFVLAFVFGMLANRLKLSPLVGYLVAGVVVGPFTPGYTADTELAPQLAEVGVILLMFGVGLHFSPADLMKVRKVAIPGALVQISVATVLGWGLGRLLGMGDLEAALMGFALSVASTVVLLRALEERKQVKGEIGRIAVGWLIVEDLVIVIALVLLPLIVIQPGESLTAGELAGSIGLTLVKVAAFVGLMLVVGGRVLPWLLVRIAHTRSRELFTLGVLAIALGIAWIAYAVFGASFALGAFVAGLVLNGTPLGHNAAERSLPLRDAFAVLFFVSVGMLFDPTILIRDPLAVLGVLGIVIIGKSLAALAITFAFRLTRETSLTVAASLAQIGEFSFILAALGVSLGAMRQETHDLILAAALLSIALNPFVFALCDRFGGRPKAGTDGARALAVAAEADAKRPNPATA